MTGLPDWCRLVRADNPGPMTLDGTNTYLLTCREGVVVIDPGPLLADHLARVAAYGPVVVTVLTHGHADHAESAQRFHETTGAPVLARDPALCQAGGPLDVDGQVLDLGDLALRVLHTPGHTADSVCLLVQGRAEDALLTGDTVLGRGSTVVAHPEGRLADYLASLQRLRALGPMVLLPGHGPVRADSAAVVDGYLAHRARRLEEVRRAREAGARTAWQVVELVYADVDRALWPAAELSVRAQLDYLDELAGAG